MSRHKIGDLLHSIPSRQHNWHKSIMTLIFRLVSVGLLLSLPLSQPLWARGAIETKQVLVLYSEDSAHPAHKLTDQGIRSAFGSNTLFDVQLYDEYLDVTRFSGPANAHAFADYLCRKYASVKIDTIIAVYPAAVEFLLGEGIDIFPDTPIVANEVSKDYAKNLKHSPPTRSITGTIMGDNAAGVLDSAFRMRPGTKRVALVGGMAPNNIYSEQVARKGLEPYLEKLDLIDLTRLPMEEINQIWDRLYRSDRSRSKRGLGLGLSLVRAIVEAHGGKVKVESRLDAGSTFFVMLPKTGLFLN
jgi:hypothetical protein